MIGAARLRSPGEIPSRPGDADEFREAIDSANSLGEMGGTDSEGCSAKKPAGALEGAIGVPVRVLG